MPKMPGGDEGEKKEETAESREEAKEQVGDNLMANIFIKYPPLRSALNNKLLKKRRKKEQNIMQNRKNPRKPKGQNIEKRFQKKLFIFFLNTFVSSIKLIHPLNPLMRKKKALMKKMMALDQRKRSRRMIQLQVS